DDLGEPRGDVAECLGQRRGIRVGVDEDERPPGVDRDLLEPELVEVEAGLAVRARRRPQRAVEPVRPRVVWALQGLAPAGAGGDDVAAVPADVEERSEPAVARACNHYGNLSGGRGEVGAVALELPGVAGVLPGAREDPLPLAPQRL